MRAHTQEILLDLVTRYPRLECVQDGVRQAVELLADAYKAGNKLLVCGNGGSAADALHIVGELMKEFAARRRLPDDIRDRILSVAGDDADRILGGLQGALPAIALVSETALETAFANDVAPELSFAQQVLGYGNPGDVLLGISTSGNSKNVLYAAEVARAKNVKVVALTGASGGKMKALCDCLINVPETETYKIQELHLPVYHAVCLALESEFFGGA